MLKKKLSKKEFNQLIKLMSIEEISEKYLFEEKWTINKTGLLNEIFSFLLKNWSKFIVVILIFLVCFLAYLGYVKYNEERNNQNLKINQLQEQLKDSEENAKVYKENAEGLLVTLRDKATEIDSYKADRKNLADKSNKDNSDAETRLFFESLPVETSKCVVKNNLINKPYTCINDKVKVVIECTPDNKFTDISSLHRCIISGANIKFDCFFNKNKEYPIVDCAEI